MKLFSLYRICAAVAVGAVFAGNAQAQKPRIDVASSLHFVVENIASVDGPIMVQILAGEAAFKGEVKPLASLVLPAQRGRIAVHLDGFPAGDYAIRVMHDVDGDGELATNLLGMPTEPWGVSNNASASFGPPTWQDARFILPSQALQTITLRH